MKLSYFIYIVVAFTTFLLLIDSSNVSLTQSSDQSLDSLVYKQQEVITHTQQATSQPFWLQILTITLGPILTLVSILFSAYFVAITLKNNRLSKFFDNMVEIDKDINPRVWGFENLSLDDLEDLKYLARILDSYCGARQMKIIKARFYSDDMLYHIMALPNNQKLWIEYIKPKMYSPDGFVDTIDRTIAYSKLTNDSDRQEFSRNNPNKSFFQSIKDYLTPDSV